MGAAWPKPLLTYLQPQEAEEKRRPYRPNEGGEGRGEEGGKQGVIVGKKTSGGGGVAPPPKPTTSSPTHARSSRGKTPTFIVANEGGEGRGWEGGKKGVHRWSDGVLDVERRAKIRLPT